MLDAVGLEAGRKPGLIASRDLGTSRRFFDLNAPSVILRKGKRGLVRACPSSDQALPLPPSRLGSSSKPKSSMKMTRSVQSTHAGKGQETKRKEKKRKNGVAR